MTIDVSDVQKRRSDRFQRMAIEADLCPSMHVSEYEKSIHMTWFYPRGRFVLEMSSDGDWVSIIPISGDDEVFRALTLREALERLKEFSRLPKEEEKTKDVEETDR